MTQEIYSGSPNGTPLPSNPMREFTMLEFVTRNLNPKPLNKFSNKVEDSTLLSTFSGKTTPFTKILHHKTIIRDFNLIQNKPHNFRIYII